MTARILGSIWPAAVLLVACALGGASATGAEFKIPLVVSEDGGRARVSEPVSGGVPLPRGLVKDPSAVKLLDSAGKEVPAQFSAINRWGSDGSVMWLLVQSTASIAANGKASYHLAPGAGTARRDPVKLEDGPEAITVDTGKLKFTVSKKKFNLIDSAWVGGQQVIAPQPRGGSVAVLSNGQIYASSAATPRKVLVEESGPERAVIVVRGLHSPEGGKGDLPYLYGYTARIRAYAGQSFLGISYALTNSSLPAIGAPVCKDLTIGVPLKLSGQVKNTGNAGWVAATNGKVGASLALRYLKENNPAALAVRKEDGVAWLELKPWSGQEQDENHLAPCNHKTYELQLAFGSGNSALDEAAGRFKSYDKSLRFWPRAEWSNSTRAWGDFGSLVVPDKEIVGGRAYQRLRPIRTTGWRLFGSCPEMESGSSSAPSGGYEPLITDVAYYLGYMQTGQRRFFDQLERTSWFWRDRRMIHLETDVSAKAWGGMYGLYANYAIKGHKSFRALQPEVYVKRYITKKTPWHYGGKWGPMDTQHFSADEVVWHYYLTGDGQCLLAINKLGEEAGYFAKNFVREVKAGTSKGASRAHGWTARALIAAYEATGEKRWMNLARESVHGIIKVQDKTAGTTYDVHERQTPFMTAVIGNALGRYYRHHPEEEVRDAILGMCDWLYYDVALAAKGFSYQWRTNNPGRRSGSGNRAMSTMAWAYLATGRKRYLEAADLHGQGKLRNWYLSGFGQEYVNVKRGKRADAVAPGQIKNLAAEVLGGGKVKLTWTAPGDDGAKGTAAEYQLKQASLPIKDHSDWRTEAGKTLSFWAATNCKGEPAPAAAGTAESHTVEDLKPGLHWFAVKAYDEQPNQSDLSNVVKIEVK